MDESTSRQTTNLWRGLFVVMAVLFFLPLMTIKGCGKDDVPHTFNGLQLVFKQGAVGSLVCLITPLLMLAFVSLVRGSSLLMTGWIRASRCALAVLGGLFFLVTTFILGMFSKLELEPAGMLLIGSFGLVSAVSLVGAWYSLHESRWRLPSNDHPRLQTWYRRVLPILWVGVVPLACLVLNSFDKDGLQAGGAMLALGIPLAMSEWFIGVGLSRREAWVVRAIGLEAVMESLITLAVAISAVATVRSLKQNASIVIPLLFVLVIPYLGLAVWVWLRRRELVDVEGP